MELFQVSIDEADLRDLERLDAQLKKDPLPVLEDIADRLEGFLRKHLTSGEHAPLAASTLEIRQRRGRPGSKPLVDTGDTLAGIRSRATKTMARASAPWPALPVQLGGTTSKTAAIPGAKVPPRPFVFIREDEQEELFDAVEEFYFDAPPGV